MPRGSAPGERRGGRQKGTPNKCTAEIREFALSIVADPVYQEKLRARALEGSLHPTVESMLFHYAHGKPVEQISVHHGGEINIVDRARVANTRIERLRRASQGTSQELREPTD